MNQNFSFSSALGTQKQATFISTVWMYFGLAIGVSALGSWAAPVFVTNTFSFWAVVIAHLGMMLFSHKWTRNEALAVPLFFVFAFLSGAVLYPLLAFAAMSGKIDVIFQALLASSATFFAAAAFGFYTKKNLAPMGQFLAMAMMGLFVIGIISMLSTAMGWGLFNSTFSLVFSAISIVLFSAYTSYDLQMIKNGAYDSPIEAALHLFINMFALFHNMLSMFLAFSD